MAFCGNCGTSVSGQPFCPSCGTQVGILQSANQPASPPIEQSLFDEADIFISPSRFVSGSQTFAMSGVTSVGAGTEFPSKKGPLLAILVGAFITFCGLITIAKGGIIAMILGAGTIVLGVMVWKKRVPVHSVPSEVSPANRRQPAAQIWIWFNISFPHSIKLLCCAAETLSNNVFNAMHRI